MSTEESLLDENAIITPPKMNFKDIPVRKYRYIIDSRDRNTNVYKTPSKYTIELDESLTDVVSAELVLTDFQFNLYNVSKNNCMLYTSAGNYELQHGIYTGDSLANALSEITPFIATFNNITNRITLTAIETTTLIFKKDTKKQYDYEAYVDVYPENCIGKTLGFDIQNYELVANTPLEAPYVVNLHSDNYIIMYMQQAKVYHSKNNNAHNAFAIINKQETDTYGINMYNNEVKKYFNPPIPDLKKLIFKFCNYSGDLYDFQNKDHRFEIVFTCLKQTRCYSEIFK